MVPVVGRALQVERRLAIVRLFAATRRSCSAHNPACRRGCRPPALRRRDASYVNGHRGGIHRNQVMIDAQAVALCIAVGEQAALQHLVRREADAGRTLAGLKAACSTSAK